MQWQEEKTWQDVELRDKNRPDTGFLSWSNYIKQYRDDPVKRFEAAQAFLPWPLGFKESILALRAIIRDKKKANIDFEPELQALYKLAAWASFYPKHSERVDEAGFKIFETIPGGDIAGLAIDYSTLGYNELKLLNKTDAKMLVQHYGEPKQHTSLNDLYSDTWQQAEERYLQQQSALVSDNENSKKSAETQARESEHEVNDQSDEIGDKSNIEVNTKDTKPLEPQEAVHSTNTDIYSQPVDDTEVPVSQDSAADADPASILSSDESGAALREDISTDEDEASNEQSEQQSYPLITVSHEQGKTKQVAALVKQLLPNKLLSKALLGIKRLSYKKKLWAILGVGCLVAVKKVRAK